MVTHLLHLLEEKAKKELSGNCYNPKVPCIYIIVLFLANYISTSER